MRKSIAFGVVVFVVLAIVAGAGYTLWSKAEGSTRGQDVTQRPVAQEPEGATPSKNKSDAQQQPANEENAKPVAQCAGPLPERSRVQFSDLPVAKLGEWLEVKNKEGRVALRFKVDLLDMAQIGYADHGNGLRTPVVSGLFLMRVENRSCEDLNWPIRRGGLWISWTKAHPKDVSVAWQSVDLGGRLGGTVDVLLQENGKFNTRDNDERIQKGIQLVLNRAFGKTALKEVPKSIPAGQATEFEMVISTFDPYLQRRTPIGLYGDGRYFLALGGELSWGMIDLGRAQDWINKTGLRVERP